LLEAINLALKCQLSRRPAAYELHPFLFGSKTVADFIASHKAGKPKPPPEILIELYLRDHKDLAVLKGTMNSEMLDQPGIALKIKLDDNFKDEYREYVKNPDELGSFPVEYYEIEWLSFAGDILASKAIPVKSVLIDPSSISNTHAANQIHPRYQPPIFPKNQDFVFRHLPPLSTFQRPPVSKKWPH
jgi:hypothetical protein